MLNFVLPASVPKKCPWQLSGNLLNLNLKNSFSDFFALRIYLSSVSFERCHTNINKFICKVKYYISYKLIASRSTYQPIIGAQHGEQMYVTGKLLGLTPYPGPKENFGVDLRCVRNPAFWLVENCPPELSLLLIMLELQRRVYLDN